MIQRCFNHNNPGYKNYGGRGITVCGRWREFENFLKDMGEKPDGLTIERVDNEKDYEPGNCVWATRAEQARNRGYCVFLTLNGKRQTVAEWARETGIPRTTLYRRVRVYGWSDERALMP